jgi:hypothetical protein
VLTHYNCVASASRGGTIGRAEAQKNVPRKNLLGSTGQALRSTPQHHQDTQHRQVTLPERGYMSRLVGQCIRQPSVSDVHSDIMTQDGGICQVQFVEV